MVKRLEQTSHENIVYHVSNRCYQSYTHSKVLKHLEERADIETGDSAYVEIIAICTSEHPSTRVKITPRHPLPTSSDNVLVYKNKSTVSGNVKFKDERKKYCICEDDRAVRFLKADVFFQDDVYYRTSDLQDVNTVFGADLYCHKNYITNYLVKYGRASEKRETRSLQSLKNRCLACLLKDIDVPLKDREGFCLSNPRDRVICCSGSKQTFSNRDIRLFLQSHYGSDLSISIPSEVNKSFMVFLQATAATEMADVIHSNNAIIQCTAKIRQALLHFDFDLQIKFCDTLDLKESWNDMKILDDILTFLCSLVNCNLNDLAKQRQSICDDFSDEDDDDDDNSGGESNTNNESYAQVSKWREIKSLFQILYFTVHNGKRRSPLPLLCAEGVHATCKSKTLITELNHLVSE